MRIRKMTLLLTAMLPWCAWATGEPSGYNADNKTLIISQPSDLTWLDTQVSGGNTFEDWTITLEPSGGGNELDMSSETSFTPIGDKDHQFKGTFDGNGKAITNLTTGALNLTCSGLFAYVGTGGVVKNLTIGESCVINGKDYLGSIAGKNEGTIQNCVNHGKINSSSSSSPVGGIVGESSGIVSDCINDGEIILGDKASRAGGIVGNNKGEVLYCKNYSSVSAKSQVGGIAGIQNNGRITYCSNYGNIVASGEGNNTAQVGGIIGNASSGEISFCFTSGDVTKTYPETTSTNNYTGAVIGMMENQVTLIDCYYDFNVTVSIAFIENNKTVTKEYTSESTGGCGIGLGNKPGDSQGSYTVYSSTTLTPTQVSGTYWTTYYNGVCSMKVVDNTTTTVYAATRNGTTLTLKEVTDGIINKGQGVILKSTAESITMTSTSDMSAGNAYTGNVLSGVDEETAQTSGNTYYVLSKSSTDETVNEVGFYKYSSAYSLAAHKAFMSVEGAQSIRSFVFEDDAAGIRLVEAKEQQGAPQVYDLQGRSVPTMKKGIYVVNSKKIWNR